LMDTARAGIGMTFLWYEALWLLLAVPLLVALYLAWLHRRKRTTLAYPSLALLEGAITRSQRIRRHLPPALVMTALVALIVATARPAAVLELPAREGTVVLAIDVSLSMAATDVKPNRLAAAQAAAKTFIDAQPRDVKVGVVAFAGEADLVQVPTRDRAALKAAIDRLQLQYHTAVGSAILASLLTIHPDADIGEGYEIFGSNRSPRALHAARHASAPAGEPPQAAPITPGSNSSAAIVLLTDGETTVGISPKKAAGKAADYGIRVYTVGFGKAQGGLVETDGWSMHVGFDERSLKEIAKITAAEYFHASTGEQLSGIYKQLSGRLMVEKRETEMSAVFTGLAAVLSLSSALLSVGWSTRLV
jgi:Ca-activated chloride channel homolog